MISYTCVGTNDVERARRFYEPLFSLMGAKPMFNSDRGFSFGVDPKQPMFMVLKPYDGQAATVGNGMMITLAAKDKAQVEALHAKALELGGQDEGAPGRRFGGMGAEDQEAKREEARHLGNLTDGRGTASPCPPRRSPPTCRHAPPHRPALPDLGFASRRRQILGQLPGLGQAGGTDLPLDLQPLVACGREDRPRRHRAPARLRNGRVQRR